MKTNATLQPKLIFCLFLFFQMDYFAQNYFVTSAKDTVACSQINFFDTNAQGRMIDLENQNFLNWNGLEANRPCFSS
ncbi:MAG: hypothetical protein EBS09_07315 [Flavobacteriia bacterium]|nr:hypothetical protein [Flavobacteriia bacterium]